MNSTTPRELPAYEARLRELTLANAALQSENAALKVKVSATEQHILDLQEQVGKLRAQNQQLESDPPPKLTFRAPFYYADGDAAPFCPACWDGQRKPVHLHPPVSVVAGPRYDCPVCRTSIVHPQNDLTQPDYHPFPYT